MSGLGEGVALGSDVAFQSVIDSFGNSASQAISRAGTSFSNVFNTFSGASATETGTGILENIYNSFKSISAKLGTDFGSSISGPTSKATNTATQTIRISPRINSNLVIGAGATVATTGLIALTATNAGVQQTTQQVAKNLSGPLQTLANAANTTSQTANSIFTGKYGGLLLIGGLALAVVLLLKK